MAQDTEVERLRKERDDAEARAKHAEKLAHELQQRLAGQEGND